ncbi:MAG: DNA primase [Firmicutes bacterium]|nr:DNA primase [Bacillota bacterium]
MNGLRSDSIVDEIKSRCNIVDVIGQHGALKRAGSNHKGLCPFHGEKTPSCVVSEQKQIFTCFGCGATGDVIEFTKRYYNLDFQEAVEKLANQYGIEIRKFGGGDNQKREAMYELNRKAARYFLDSFRKIPNPALSYMAKRGLDAKTLNQFGIGFADANWDSLYKYLLSEGADVNMMKELGLISESKGKCFDKFRNRVMFPIINTRGKVIGFGGRVLDDGTPKYLNSPESPIFLKKNNLFGLNLTRQDINKNDCAILVEGYMDVISLYKAGVRNVSASLGTALTENQAAMLKRYTKNVILCYDSDGAGRAAALRGMDILRAAGCNVKVMHVTDGKDPDEFVKAHGAEAFYALTKTAKPFADYKIDLIRQETDLTTTEGSLEFLHRVTSVLKSLSPGEADLYIGKIAADTHISEGAIRMEVFGNGFGGGKKEEPVNTAVRTEQDTGRRKDGTDPVLYLEKNLIRLMLAQSDFIQRTQPYESVFRDAVYRKIYETMKGLYREDEEIDVGKLADSLEPEEVAVLSDILENVKLTDKEEDVFLDCVTRIRNERLSRREQQIIQMLSLADDETDLAKVEELTRELMTIQQQKNNRE